MALTKIDDRGLKTPVDLLDNEKIRFGTGNDLEIYHDGSNSYLQDAGTGALRIQSNDARIINAAGSEDMARFIEDGAVELYYDNVKKFETTSAGAKITGQTHLDGGTYFNYAGNGTNYFTQADGGETYFRNASGTNRTLINTSGNWKWYDDQKVMLGTSDDLQIYHDGTDNWIYANLANKYAITVHNDGANSNRYGIASWCGSDDGTGTNYPIWFFDGNGTSQGGVSMVSGTVSYGAFTAHHPCIVPDADNPSDESMAYPYGTLLETISIEYTKKKDGSDTERGIRYKVQKTQSANSRKVLGAYGSSMNGGPDGETNLHQTLVLGDGHILCNNAGGNIEVGDGICSSSTAGIGQKATVNPSMIIGIAQEAVTFTGSETKLVAVQYGLQQFIPWT